MTDTSVLATNSTFPVRGGWPLRIAIVAVLTALADFLFFRQSVGISLALFIVAVAAGVLLANRTGASRRELLSYGGILVAALLPSLEDFNVMSAPLAVLGIGAFTLGVTAALRGDLTEKSIAIAWLLVSGPLTCFRDLPLLREWAHQRGAPVSLATMKGWTIPLSLGAVFVVLFAAANPLIANWFTQWSIGDSLKQLDTLRLAFWTAAFVSVWAFVCVSRRFALFDFGLNAIPAGNERQELLRFAPPDLATGIAPTSHSNLIFNDAAVMRSLVIFNLLFAVQTVMDINYLWRGAALPDGMTYATYAHRGAYPLIATALLAAAFVIVAMRPGSAAERSPPMRALVFLWVGQNLVLVLSAMERLNLYVETYLLTYWRVAAFIWMMIVAAGLVLIVLRIVTYRSNAWLVSANTAALALTIYVCSFVNFAAVVADYNVAQDRNAAATSLPVDVTYLLGLGPQAIPAVDRYLAAHPMPPQSHVPVRRQVLAATHLRDDADWRAWTFRSWRLTRYLNNAKAQPALTPP